MPNFKTGEIKNGYRSKWKTFWTR